MLDAETCALVFEIVVNDYPTNAALVQRVKSDAVEWYRRRPFDITQEVATF